MSFLSTQFNVLFDIWTELRNKVTQLGSTKSSVCLYQFYWSNHHDLIRFASIQSSSISIRFDLIWFDLIWSDLIWFDWLWFDLIALIGSNCDTIRELSMIVNSAICCGRQANYLLLANQNIGNLRLTLLHQTLFLCTRSNWIARAK